MPQLWPQSRGRELYLIGALNVKGQNVFISSGLIFLFIFEWYTEIVYINYEILEHTADFKMKAYGKDLPEVFVNMAKGVASQQLEINDLNEAGQTQGEWEEVAVETDDLESLLVDWLNEILYRSDANKKIYSDFEVLEFSESPYKIKTKIRGLPTTQKKLEIKAATYHELEIKKTDGGWQATVIFDI
ncbi:MAG: hypothetical protein LiPW39_93 [Parcubacteria group bacterium LiPW_39]|nr:MAG: hypothetical protein LiPW39_93 [Parcubacteria group bacterium LiPW_39]